ncbi:putative ribonuclease H-like domain-containing protein [Tanacetum coccineum]
MQEDEKVLPDDLKNMIAQEATSTNILSTGSTATTPYDSAASTPTGANAGESSFVYLGGKIPIDAYILPNADLPIDLNMPDLEDASDTLPNDGIFNGAYDNYEDVGAVADFHNLDNTIVVSPIPTLRIHKDHPKGQILGDPTSAVQTRGKIQKASSAQQALFKLQQVWILMDLPFGKKAIGTKWVFRNKRDERSIVVKNKARLVAQGHRQEEGIDYDEVFAPIARIEAIRLFLAFASYMGFLVYQMDVKSAFLYGTIEEEVYVHQPPGFVDPAHPNKVYKVVKALYGLHQAPRAWYETLSSFLLENGFRREVYVDDPLVSLVRESMKEKSTDFVTATKASGEAQEEEEISPTILEAAKTLSKVASQSVSKAKSTDKGKRYRRRARSMAKKIDTGLDAEEEINTGREEINTGIEEVSTGSTKVDSGTASKRGQREGKAPMVEEDIQATHKTKEQMRQEEAGLEEAIKLQAQLDEEVAKQIHLDKMIAKRMAEEEAFNKRKEKLKFNLKLNFILKKTGMLLKLS